MIIALFSALAARTGLSRTTLAVGGLIAFACALWAGKWLYDRSVIRDHESEQAAKLAPVLRQADAKAADQRAEDVERNRNEEAAERAAVAPLPDAGLTDRQRARACAILLRQGTSHDRLPARCRPAQ